MIDSMFDQLKQNREDNLKSLKDIEQEMNKQRN